MHACVCECLCVCVCICKNAALLFMPVLNNTFASGESVLTASASALALALALALASLPIAAIISN